MPSRPLPLVLLGTVLLGTALVGCAAPSQPGPQAGAPAAPRVMRKATQMGVGVQIASFARWNERCEASGLPQAVVVAEPPHGTLTARPVLVTAGSRLFSGGTSCRDKQIEGIEMWYTPQPGFRGTDPMSFEVTSGGDPTRFSATVDVR